MLAVTEEDIKRVAVTYFKPENRSIAVYFREEGTSAPEIPTELADLPPEAQRQIMSQLEQIRAAQDVELLKTMLGQLGAQASQAPPQFQKVFPLIERTLQERIAELEGAP